MVLFWSALVDGLILARLIDPQRLDPAAWSEQIAKLLWGGLQPHSLSQNKDKK